MAANNPHGPSLLDRDKLALRLAQGATAAVGPVLMERANPQIKRYLDSVRTDPALDEKHHRSYKLDPTRKTATGWWMTAWCAAFVNCCLTQVDSAHLGCATAASWLNFEAPLAHPEYGEFVVIAPGSDSAGTTGHVAFYGGSVGNEIWMLGGNQRQQVCLDAEAGQFGPRLPLAGGRGELPGTGGGNCRRLTVT